ncbi:CHAT domain-containing tetratricopeptide repeat protein [Amycolatopsis sp.]|uniref:CHAT domain-containing protein n=1 Tax=Amycolatopsis sp. TaxID=37632 RepID=UPI002E02DA64|nr:CHAT domain-containing tetratricopeptide repeat protein [Amycolatopsis sp.]
MPQVSHSEIATRVRELHKRGVELTNGGHPVAGAQSLRAGLLLLGWPEATQTAPSNWPEWGLLTARLLGGLAVMEVAQGNSELGFSLVERAEALVPPEDRGILLQNRGLMLTLIGRMEEALGCFDDAIPLLRQTNEQLVLTRSLLNRGMLHQIAGRVRLAVADLEQCEQVAMALGGVGDGIPRTIAKAAHGRGQCLVMTGDIPGALREFDKAGLVYAEQGGGMLPVLAADKARALLAAGLPTEAAAELDVALEKFPGSRMNQEHAEAELTRARVALALGDAATGRSWAVRAERRFERRGNATWAAVAALTRLRADFVARRRLSAVASGAAELAVRLKALGLPNDGEVAELLAARANIALGLFGEARGHLGGRDRAGAPLETRLLRRLALAELGAATGETRETFANARAGLTVLREHRGRFGSVDLQTGATLLGGSLAEAGLAAALGQGSPPVVYRWLERSRAQAFQIRPVHRPADSATVDAVAELRLLAQQVRLAELDGRKEPEMRRRCVQLERDIRAKGWQLDGTGEYHAPAGLGELSAELAVANSAGISFLSDRGRLRALVISGGKPSLVGLGDAATVFESISRLHSDLDALCGRRLPAALDKVIRSSAQSQQQMLAKHLLEPLMPLVGDLDVVLMPTGALSAVPWGLLPGLSGRPVTVTPSPSAWLAAKLGEPPARRPLLIAGPGLEHASDEVAKLAEIYPEAIVLQGEAATVEATLKALDGSTSVHLAAHGHHEQENVLFSRLDLVDGPLMAYDIHQLDAAPDHVVLSACDVGQTVVRTGDEVLGFTAALLYSGCKTVVSSVARVDDQAAESVMVAYHRALTQGYAPARALADAALVEPLVPLVCFGRGS